MPKWIAMVLALAALSAPAFGLVLAPYAAVALPQLLAEADLVVVVDGGEVKKGKIEKRTLTLPGRDQPAEGAFTVYIAKIESVLGGAEAKGLTGQDKEPTLTFLSEQPKAEPGKIRPIRPPVRGGVRPMPPVPGRITPRFVAGRKYVLILQALADSEAYLLPSRPGYYRMASDSLIAQARKLANVEQWSWGRADEAGLQAAVLPRQEHLPSYQGRAAVNLLAVVRNTGDKPVRFSLHPRNKPIHLLAINAEGTVVQGDPYTGRLASYNPGLVNQPKYIQHELGPGEMAFVGLNGLSGWGFQTQMDLPEGKWKLHVILRGKDDDGGRLWTGEIRSKGVEVKVQPRKQRTIRRGVQIEVPPVPGR